MSKTDFDIKNRDIENPYDYLKQIYPQLSKEINKLQKMNKDKGSVIADLKNTLSELIEEVSAGGNPDKRRGHKYNMDPSKLPYYESEQRKVNPIRPDIDKPKPIEDTPVSDHMAKELEKLAEENQLDTEEQKEVQEELMEKMYAFRLVEKGFATFIAQPVMKKIQEINEKNKDISPIKIEVDNYDLRIPALTKESDYEILPSLKVQLKITVPKFTTLENFEKKLLASLGKLQKEGEIEESSYKRFKERYQQTKQKTAKHTALLNYIESLDGVSEENKKKIKKLKAYSEAYLALDTIIAKGMSAVERAKTRAEGTLDFDNYKSINKKTDNTFTVGFDWDGLELLNLTDLYGAFPKKLTSYAKNYKTAKDAMQAIRMKMISAGGKFKSTYLKLLEEGKTTNKENNITSVIADTIDKQLGIKILK